MDYLIGMAITIGITMGLVVMVGVVKALIENWLLERKEEESKYKDRNYKVIE